MSAKVRVWLALLLLVVGVYAVLVHHVRSLRTHVAEREQALVACQERLAALEKQKLNPDFMMSLVLPNAKPYVPERFIRETVEQALQYPNGMFLLALITVESHFDPFAVSSAGAVGCGQVKPSNWHRYLSDKGIVASKRDYRDPRKCVDIAAAVLEYFLDRTDGRIVEALAQYRCGENDKTCIQGAGQRYAASILKQYGEYMWALTNDHFKVEASASR